MSIERKFDDYSQNFSSVRQRIKTTSNSDYSTFLQSLKPNYGIVYRDIILGYVALLIILSIVITTQDLALYGAIVVLGAIIVGYWIAYLQLFTHEAAHYNIAPSRTWNDRLCDFLISWLVGQSIRRYRKIHFGHHRNLGSPEDTERSYFSALTLKFLLEALTGIHAVRVLLQRNETLKPTERSGDSRWPVVRSAIIHLAICILLAVFGTWGAVVTWILGVGLFVPFFVTVRQLLEHRDELADPNVDYQCQPHGAVTRLFGNDIFSATFGGAGFNRHLLHHWEPQISYTRLAELETFLMQTEVASIIESRRSNYWSVLFRLLRTKS